MLEKHEETEVAAERYCIPTQRGNDDKDDDNVDDDVQSWSLSFTLLFLRRLLALSLIRFGSLLVP